MKKILYLSLSLLFLSCQEQGTAESIPESTLVENDSTEKVEKLTLDSTTVENYEQANAVVSAEIIEKTYGKQWDFCDCIRKTDSIQKVIDTDTEISDTDFDNLMARFEEIDRHCKSIIASPNTTPDERKRHQKKVNNCLK